MRRGSLLLAMLFLSLGADCQGPAASNLPTDLAGDTPEDPNGIDLKADTDGDGITDGDELYLYGTNRLLDDSDFDGLSDHEELFTTLTNPLLADSDLDGLRDALEIEWGSDPLAVDTDADGFVDGDEITMGLDLLIPNAIGYVEEVLCDEFAVIEGFFETSCVYYVVGSSTSPDSSDFGDAVMAGDMVIQRPSGLIRVLPPFRPYFTAGVLGRGPSSQVTITGFGYSMFGRLVIYSGVSSSYSVSLFDEDEAMDWCVGNRVTFASENSPYGVVLFMINLTLCEEVMVSAT